MKAFAYLAATVLVAIAIGVGVSASTWNQKLTKFNDQFLRFDYPASWSAREPDQGVVTSINELVFLSNERMHAPCVTRGTAVTCSYLLKRLSAGGILVDWEENGLPGWTLDEAAGYPISVDGHRGKESVLYWQGSCVSGTEQDIAVVIVRSAADNYYEMNACLRGPDLADEQSEIQAMLASAKVLLP